MNAIVVVIVVAAVVVIVLRVATLLVVVRIGSSTRSNDSKSGVTSNYVVYHKMNMA